MRMICKGTGMRCTRDGYDVYKDRVYIVQGTDMICTRARYTLYKGRISVLNGILFLLFSTYNQAKAKQKFERN